MLDEFGRLSGLEAIEWLKRAPFQEGEVEIRRLIEAEDFECRLSERRQVRAWSGALRWVAARATLFSGVKAELSAASPATRPSPASG